MKILLTNDADELKKAMEARHSVRAFRDEPIHGEIRKALDALADEINRESGLHIRIRYDDPAGFDSRLAHYGSFRQVHDYIILAGPASMDLDKACGYYGEQLVLLAQMLGLNTCWAALTFNRRQVKNLLEPGEKLCMVIALGFGEKQGVPHRGKKPEDLTDTLEGKPDWFIHGLEAACLAPTAVNQQKFLFTLQGDVPEGRTRGIGTCLKVDLGIAALHFENGSGKPVRI